MQAEWLLEVNNSVKSSAAICTVYVSEVVSLEC